MQFDWRTESDTPAPARVTPVDDRLTATDAVRRTRRGEHLLYQGDFHNARQLLAAMARRLPKEGGTFAAERAARQLEHQTLGRIVVALDAQYALGLRRAPDTALACRQVWGEPQQATTVVSLKTLLGMLGAAELRRKGLEVPGLKGKLTPHYGVWVPTRTEYLDLLEHLDVKGKRVLDLGCGTGVIGLMLLQRGAAHVTASDQDERAVACTRENAAKLKLADRLTAVQADGYPDGRWDLVVCNPPWLPATPKTRVDRAVFDEGGAFLLAFLDGLAAHATRGALILSNLAELLGLRAPGWLDPTRLVAKHDTRPTHGKAKDRSDPLHAARSQEVTSLYVVSGTP